MSKLKIPQIPTPSVFSNTDNSSCDELLKDLGLYPLPKNVKIDISSDNRYLNYKTEKIKLSSFKLNLINSKLNYNFKTKNEKVIDIITNDIKPFLKSSSHNELNNKNVQVNIEHKYKRNNIPFYKNSLLKKNFYSSLSIKNKMKIKKKM